MSAHINQGALNRLLPPTTLAGLANLELVARTAVEGFLTGLHRSPHYGFSQEFKDLFCDCRSQAERGFVRDAEHWRAGQHGGQAQHLLLAAGEVPGSRFPPRGEHREALEDPSCLVMTQHECQVVLHAESGEDASRLGYEA